MEDDAKSPENSGDNACNLLDNLAAQGISLNDVVKNMTPEQAHSLLMSQYNLLYEKYESISKQLEMIQRDTKKDSRETIQRIERILALMTSNLSFLKEMIKIEDLNNDKLIQQEKINAKQELQFVSLVERQNRFASSLDNLDKNNQSIIEEISKLKENDLKHDKFQFQILSVVAIVGTIAAWLMTGDNFAKLIIIVNTLMSPSAQ